LVGEEWNVGRMIIGGLAAGAVIPAHAALMIRITK
jgi:gas vesicle protein